MTDEDRINLSVAQTSEINATALSLMSAGYSLNDMISTVTMLPHLRRSSLLETAEEFIRYEQMANSLAGQLVNCQGPSDVTEVKSKLLTMMQLPGPSGKSAIGIYQLLERLFPPRSTTGEWSDR